MCYCDYNNRKLCALLVATRQYAKKGVRKFTELHRITQDYTELQGGAPDYTGLHRITPNLRAGHRSTWWAQVQGKASKYRAGRLDEKSVRLRS